MLPQLTQMFSAACGHVLKGIVMENEINPLMSVGSNYENELVLFRQWMFRHFEGRVMTLIETLGFDPKREEAVKSIFRSEIWDTYWKEGMHYEEIDEYLKPMFDKREDANQTSQSGKR